jgi:hypothetical protein
LDDKWSRSRGGRPCRLLIQSRATERARRAGGYQWPARVTVPLRGPLDEVRSAEVVDMDQVGRLLVDLAADSECPRHSTAWWTPSPRPGNPSRPRGMRRHSRRTLTDDHDVVVEACHFLSLRRMPPQDHGPPRRRPSTSLLHSRDDGTSIRPLRHRPPPPPSRGDSSSPAAGNGDDHQHRRGQGAWLAASAS